MSRRTTSPARASIELPPVVPDPVVSVHVRLIVGAADAAPANATATIVAIIPIVSLRISIISSILSNKNSID
jgi:hypothetical protein